MKRKLLAQDIINYLVQQKGCTQKEAESFVHSFFNTIEQGLLQDKFVKVKGLGTFKLVVVNERESINIKTGERFQIGEHTKISFTPDNTMKELINKPFAHFETITLNEDVDVTEFDKIDQEMKETEEIEEEYSEGNMGNINNEASKESLPINTSEDTQENEEQPITVSNNEEVENISSIKDDEKSSIAHSHLDNSSSSKNEIQVKNIPLPITEEKTTDSENDSNNEVTENKVEDNHEGIGETNDKKQDCAENKANEESSNQQENLTKPYTNNGTGFRYFYTERPPKRKRNVWKTVAIVLGIILLMIACYFAGYYRMLCPCSLPFAEKWANVEIENADTTVQLYHKDSVFLRITNDSVHKPTPTIKKEKNTNSTVKAKSNTTPKKKEKADVSNTSTQTSTMQQQPIEKNDTLSNKNENKPSYHVVKTGDNLYKISRKYYGSDKYVNAIIKLNNLRNADNIVKGKKLKLP